MRMNRLIMLLGMVMVLVWATASAQNPPAPSPATATQGKAKIVFETLVHDFGEVPPNSQSAYDFVFKNEGDGLLEIGNISSSCGCTAALTDKKTLNSGESSKVSVKYHASTYAGPFEKTISVNCNDPEKSVVLLRITGKIVSDLQWSPESLSFVNVERDKTTTASVEIIPKTPEGFEISDLHSDVPFLMPTVSKMDNGHLQLQVVFDPSKNLPAGDFHYGNIIFKTTSKNFPEVKITANVRLLQEFFTVPIRLFIIKSKPGEALTRDLLVKSGKSTAFHISEVMTSNTFVKAEIKQNDSNTNVVKVTVDEGIPGPVLPGIITIKIGDKSLSVSFRISIEAAASVQ